MPKDRPNLAGTWPGQQQAAILDLRLSQNVVREVRGRRPPSQLGGTCSRRLGQHDESVYVAARQSLPFCGSGLEVGELAPLPKPLCRLPGKRGRAAQDAQPHVATKRIRIPSTADPLALN